MGVSVVTCTCSTETKNYKVAYLLCKLTTTARIIISKKLQIFLQFSHATKQSD